MDQNNIMNNELKSLTQLMLPKLEEEMRLIFMSNDSQSDPFYGMMQYHMGWLDASFQPTTVRKGKRIRPLLTMISCQAAGGDWIKAVPAAAAIEILHNFSLVHDDIEDASSTRRGRKTVWKIWGEAQAINSGDAMFALAHLVMTWLTNHDVPAETIVRAIRRFDETCFLLTQGQYYDMDFETRADVRVEEYIKMIAGKTAVLIALCAELGPVIAGQDESIIEHYAEFGLNLGMAFQVIDDILGIGEEIESFLDGEFQDVIDVFSFVQHIEYFRLESFAAAGFTFQTHIGEKLHFNHLLSFPFAGIAATAIYVEREVLGFKSPDVR